MKTIQHRNTAKDKTLHIETELGIITVRVGLYDTDGNEVESIQISFDKGEGIILDGQRNNRLIKKGG